MESQLFLIFIICEAFLLEYHLSLKEKITDQTTLIKNLVIVTCLQDDNFCQIFLCTTGTTLIMFIKFKLSFFFSLYLPISCIPIPPLWQS